MKNTHKLTLLAGIASCYVLGVVSAANTAVVSSEVITAPVAATETVSLVLTGLK